MEELLREEEYIDQFIVETVEENNETNERVKWQDPETKFLIELYHSHIGSVGPERTKKFKKKEFLWPFFSLEFKKMNYSFTPKQIKNKFTQLERQYKKVIDNNKRTGNNRRTCPFQKELNELFQKKSSVNPPYLLGTEKMPRLTETLQAEQHALGNSPPPSSNLQQQQPTLSVNPEQPTVIANPQQPIVSENPQQPTVIANPQQCTSTSNLSSLSPSVTVADLQRRPHPQKRARSTTSISEEIKLLRERKASYYECKEEILRKKFSYYEMEAEKKREALDLQLKLYEKLLGTEADHSQATNK